MKHCRNPFSSARLSSGVPGVGDRAELLPRVLGTAGDLLPEVGEERVRLERCPRLARNDEEAPFEADIGRHPANGVRMGAVENVQPRVALRRSERPREHFRGEARTAHSEQDDPLESILADLVRELGQVLHPAPHRLGELHPAHPGEDDVGRRLRPQRRILAPESPPEILPLPFLKAVRDRRFEGLEVDARVHPFGT